MAKQPKAFSPSGYYRVRLEHTLKHTQQTTKLIYLINGGALGLLYFAVRMDLSLDRKKIIAAAVLFTLALINLLHALLIGRQGQWYKILDDAFAEASNAKEPDKELKRPEGFPWMGTHLIHAIIHLGLAVVLAISAVAILRISN